MMRMKGAVLVWRGGWRVGPLRFSANECKHHPKQRFAAASAAASLLPQQVEHHRLQVVAESAYSRHQPVGAETGVRVHHTLGHVHLRQRTRSHNIAKKSALSFGSGSGTTCGTTHAVRGVRGGWIRTRTFWTRKFCFQSQISSKCI